MAHQEHSSSRDDRLPSLKRWNGDEYKENEHLHNSLEDLYWPVTSWMITIVNLSFCIAAFWSMDNGYEWAKHGASVGFFSLSLMFVAGTHYQFIRDRNKDVRRDD